MAQPVIQLDPAFKPSQVVTILLMRQGDSRPHWNGDDRQRELTSSGYTACLMQSRNIRDLEIAVDLKIVSPVVCAHQTANDVFGNRVTSISCPELRLDSAHNARLLEAVRDQPEADLRSLFQDASTESALLGFGHAAARTVAQRILEAETAPKTVAVIAEGVFINAVGFAIASSSSDARRCLLASVDQTEYLVIEVTREDLAFLVAET